MAEVKATVLVNVEYFTDDEEYGPYYVASSDDLMFTTDGQTFEELLASIRECVALALKEVDTVAEYGVLPLTAIRLIRLP